MFTAHKAADIAERMLTKLDERKTKKRAAKANGDEESAPTTTMQ
jgi:hypothetical protein